MKERKKVIKLSHFKQTKLFDIQKYIDLKIEISHAVIYNKEWGPEEVIESLGYLPDEGIHTLTTKGKEKFLNVFFYCFNKLMEEDGDFALEVHRRLKEIL